MVRGNLGQAFRGNIRGKSNRRQLPLNARSFDLRPRLGCVSNDQSRDECRWDGDDRKRWRASCQGRPRQLSGATAARERRRNYRHRENPVLSALLYRRGNAQPPQLQRFAQAARGGRGQRLRPGRGRLWPDFAWLFRTQQWWKCRAVHRRDSGQPAWKQNYQRLWRPQPADSRADQFF